MRKQWICYECLKNHFKLTNENIKKLGFTILCGSKYFKCEYGKHHADTVLFLP